MALVISVGVLQWGCGYYRRSLLGSMFASTSSLNRPNSTEQTDIENGDDYNNAGACP